MYKEDVREIYPVLNQAMHMHTAVSSYAYSVVLLCVFGPIYSRRWFTLFGIYGRTSRGHTDGRLHRTLKGHFDKDTPYLEKIQTSISYAVEANRYGCVVTGTWYRPDLAC